MDDAFSRSRSLSLGGSLAASLLILQLCALARVSRSSRHQPRVPFGGSLTLLRAIKILSPRQSLFFWLKNPQHGTARGHSTTKHFGPSRLQRFQPIRRRVLFRLFELDQTSWLRKRQLQTVPLFLILRWDSSPLLGSEYRRFPSRHLPHDTRALLATCLPQASAQRFRSLENTGLGGEDRSQATAAMSSRERRTPHWPWRFPN